MKIPYKKSIVLLKFFFGIHIIPIAYFYYSQFGMAQDIREWLIFILILFTVAYLIIDAFICNKYGCLFIDKYVISRRKFFYTEKIRQKDVIRVEDSKYRFVIKTKKRDFIVSKNQISKESIQRITQRIDWFKSR